MRGVLCSCRGVTAMTLAGVLIIHSVALAAQECQPAPGIKAAVAYGIVASAKKYVSRGGTVRSWWTEDTLGAVYIDTATPECRTAGPPGMVYREEAAVLAEYTNSRGGFPTRAALVIFDLYKLYPDADWYAEMDDDTLVVPANVEVELLKYNASQPWYIGGHATKLDNEAKWGNTALGGAGIFVSRGAVQWMQESYTACALHTALLKEPGDRALGRCVLLHGIPLTHHPGMHFADGWHHQMWQHRPAAPFLAIHDNHNVPWGPHMRQALALNPSGFSQQARLRVPLPGKKRLIVHISSGIAVDVWEEGAKGTDMFHLGLPGKWLPIVTIPPQVERPGPLAHFTVTDIQGPRPGGNCSIVTTYKADKAPPGSSVRVSIVEVHEPFWPDRWHHGPTTLCITAWGISTNSSSSSSSSVSKLTVHLGEGPTGCMWEFSSIPWDTVN